MGNMTRSSIANLSRAGLYWEMARNQKSSEAAATFYKKAYAILRKEMGEKNSSTIEIRKEMMDALSNQADRMTAVCNRGHY